MKQLIVQDNSVPGEVTVERIYACDYCHDTLKIEKTDRDGFLTGYYKPCICTL